jgi:hypothetical protein
LIVNARIIPHHPTKFPVQSAMAFVDASGGFENESLSSMKSGQIRSAAG